MRVFCCIFVCCSRPRSAFVYVVAGGYVRMGDVWRYLNHTPVFAMKFVVNK